MTTTATLEKLPPGIWRLFTPDTGEDEAAAAFFAKHGIPPAFIHDVCVGAETAMPTRVLAVGPVDGKQNLGKGE